MSKDDGITITPSTRDCPVDGSGAAILVSGSSASWTASASVSWIKLNATSGNVGYPVAYTVDSNPNVEERIGYVYVSGHVHTIKQAGVGGSISPVNEDVECDGGFGTVNVTAPDKISWQARSNVDWLSVTPTSGTGEGQVTFQVAPWHDVSTRSGTLTIAGQTFTVFQYGKRMKLEQMTGTCNYEPHVFPITVNALAITKWGVTPNNSWISIVDGGNGQGSDLVSVAVGENPSYKGRTGTVTIGTETFTITQGGRTDLSFSLSPTETTASVNGANGLISIVATPDLPWTATSQADWLTVMAKFQSGSGNGNVVYTASPNPTLFERTGTITVTPEAASGVSPKKQTVTQPAALATLSISGYEFEAAGESCAVDITVANIVKWGVANLPSWITASKTSFVGPETVTLHASANDTVYPRSATIRIAEHDFTVTQKARGVEVEYDTMLFKTDGGYESISVHPDGNVAWTAVSSDPTWIVLYGAESGTGDGEILYIVAPYVGDGAARTGTITIGDKVVYVTQRAYDLTIDPYAEWVTGNAGAGEIGVSASIGDVWTAIVTDPSWISLVSGYDSGTGSGTVRFVYTENDTGKTRTGKIVIAGEVYTVTQAARTMVPVTAAVEGGGTVSGAGSYVLGTDVSLTAVPNDGWEFKYWSGDVSTMQNPVTVKADVAKSVTATFGALTPEFTSSASDETGVTLIWTNLAWAVQYKIYRAPTSENVGAVIATLTADGTHSYVDTTGDVGKTYWYWVEAVGADVMTESKLPVTGKKANPIVISNITYTNLKGATHSNPSTYQEGMGVTFAVPGAIPGYTFARWMPAAITKVMTGDQTVQAVWTANDYSIVFHANGGSGAMADLLMTYDVESSVTSNGFVRAGYAFKGWATESEGQVVYMDGAALSNLTVQAGGVVELFAVWELTGVPDPIITPVDGSSFTGDSCEVSISCPLDGATIYFTTNGANPKVSELCRYSASFAIANTTTIKAFAAYDKVYSSPVTATITKRVLTLPNSLDADLVFATGGDAAWKPVLDDTSAVGDACAVSGAINDNGTSWIKTTVSGPGTFSFWWKANCEADMWGEAACDRLVVYTNDIEVARIDGASDWDQVMISFGKGSHTIRWSYEKDYVGFEGLDCAWLDGIVWTPSEVPSDPIPEIVDPTSEKIAEVLQAAEDSKLAECITSETEYAAFRDWAGKVKGVGGEAAGSAAVMASDHAWQSFALGTEKLLEAAIEDKDLTVEEFKPTSEAGKFDFTVSVDGVDVGSEASKENLKKVFGLEGATSLGGAQGEGALPTIGSGFSSDAVDITFDTPVDGKVKFTAGPKDANAKTFFMKVKVK